MLLNGIQIRSMENDTYYTIIIKSYMYGSTKNSGFIVNLKKNKAVIPSEINQTQVELSIIYPNLFTYIWSLFWII